jgi:hypothetical protein
MRATGLFRGRIRRALGPRSSCAHFGDTSLSLSSSSLSSPDDPNRTIDENGKTATHPTISSDIIERHRFDELPRIEGNPTKARLVRRAEDWRIRLPQHECVGKTRTQYE